MIFRWAHVKAFNEHCTLGGRSSAILHKQFNLGNMTTPGRVAQAMWKRELEDLKAEEALGKKLF
jgi:hypothetical protein